MKSKRQKPVVYLGADHAGRDLKNLIKDHLVAKGYHVHDCGAFDDDPQDDYPDFILPAADGVAQSKGGALGIVLGGSGNGEAMAANKVRGIRCALVTDAYTARMAREHNDANVMSLGARTAAGKPKFALKLVDAFLGTAFSGDKRHVRRIAKITDYERKPKRTPSKPRTKRKA